jgi:hypothetical protein
MKHMIPCLLLIFAFSSLMWGQSNKYGNKATLEIIEPDGPKPWTSLDLNNDPGNFQFAIVTDRTGSHRPGVFMEGVKRLNLLQPEFVMSVGDLIEGYTEDENQLLREWEEFDGFIDQLEMPFFYVPGNHDITNKVMQDFWKKRFGPTHYYFKYKDVLFLCLDSEDNYRGSGRGTIDDNQYEWIKKVLAENNDVKWTLLFMHQPLWVQNAETLRWPDVEKLLADRQHTVFAGHRHHYVRYEYNNGNYFMLATTGGGSSLRGPEFGEFDHVVWVTMTDDGPIIANVQLEGVFDQDVVDEEKWDYITSISNRNPITIYPVFTDKKKDQGKVRIKISNDADWPMEVKLNTEFSWYYKSALAEDKIRVAPNSVEFVSLEIVKRPNRRASQGDDIRLTAKVRYDEKDLPKIQVPFEFYLGLEEKWKPAKAGRNLTVDGQLDDWKELPFDITPEEVASVSGRFGVAQDNEFVYLAVKVEDDQLMVDEKQSSWNQDQIGVILNADPLEQSAMDQGGGWYRNSFYFTTAPEVNGQAGPSNNTDNLPEGTQLKCVSVVGGYQLELAIPISYIEARQGQNWESFRLNVVIQDRDSPEEGIQRFFWQPEWRTANRVGSGMFFRR